LSISDVMISFVWRTPAARRDRAQARRDARRRRSSRQISHADVPARRSAMPAAAIAPQ
jgi:hypothetical protein